MNGPWQAGWIRIVVAVIAAWRIWAELREVWPAVAAAGGTWLRWVWQARDADEGGGAGSPPEV